MRSRYGCRDNWWPFDECRNEKYMTQRQPGVANLTSRPAGTGKLFPARLADLIVLKAKKTRLF